MSMVDADTWVDYPKSEKGEGQGVRGIPTRVHARSYPLPFVPYPWRDAYGLAGGVAGFCVAGGAAGFCVAGGAAGGVGGAAGFAPAAGAGAGLAPAAGAAGLAASKRLITSAVTSSDGSTKRAPESVQLNNRPMVSSFTIASRIGLSFSPNSACSCC